MYYLPRFQAQVCGRPYSASAKLIIEYAKTVLDVVNCSIILSCYIMYTTSIVVFWLTKFVISFDDPGE